MPRLFLLYFRAFNLYPHFSPFRRLLTNVLRANLFLRPSNLLIDRHFGPGDVRAIRAHFILFLGGNGLIFLLFRPIPSEFGG